MALSGMVPPLVQGIARAGAQRHQPDARARAPPRSSRPAGAARPPAPPGRDGSCCRCRRARRWRRRTRWRRRGFRPAPRPAIVVGHRRQADAGHVELGAVVAGGPHRVQHGGGVGARKRLGENAEPHQTAPCMSATLTGSPAAHRLRDRRHGPHRGEPVLDARARIGAPSSTASAKPSSWRRKKCPSAPSGRRQVASFSCEDLDVAGAVIPGVVGLREDAAMLAIELEALVPIHAHGHGEVEMAQRAVGEARLDEPAIGAEPLGQPGAAPR